ncbi:uncharacterized protein LOC118196854 [Stegodyphus dumicola]|uniref:uncharacterized protein LOC118196854 n=1 Tax=Stegodyphus dumicola TaxID=202533 RepID=UPI0015B16E5A|nr:uncharacterized protein LOC118196854 [Stegodyphus dumicola]
MEALSKLFDYCLTPVTIVCNGEANNMMCYTKAMRVTKERPYIMCQDRKVFTVFDVPHLLKCLRNNFIKYDVKFLNGKVASWEHIKSLWEFDRQMPHRIAPKLSDRHVNVEGLSTMNVKLAAQVFSHSVTVRLCFLSAVGRLPASASHTADFCSNVKKLFDSLNSRKINHNNPFLSARMFLLFDVSLHPERLKKFFSVVRRRGGNNDHPTAYDFQQRMRFLMAQNVISISRLSNCEPDHDTVLIPAEVLIVNKNSEPLFGNEGNELEIDFDDPLLSLTETAGNAVDIPIAGAVHDVFEQNSSAYVAGYTAKRALKQFSLCLLCKSVLVSNQYLDTHTYFLHFKEYDFMKEGLCYPSHQFTLFVCEVGKRFKTVFEKICNHKNVKTKIISELKTI